MKNIVCAYVYCNNLDHIKDKLFQDEFSKKIDIIYYSFIKIEENANLLFPSSFTKYLNNILSLKENNTKISVSINNQKALSKVCNDEILRKQLVNNLIDFLLKNKINGIDIDWEVPGSSNLSIEVDKSNLNQFVKELKENMIKYIEDPILSIAIFGTPLGDNRYDYAFLNQYIDYYNVMSYDANIDEVTSHNCPLYKNEYLNRNYSIDEAYHKLLKAKIDPNKLVLSCAFYGRIYQIIEDMTDGIVIGKKAKYLESEYKNGVAHYFYIKQHYNKETGFEEYFDSKTKAAYAYNIHSKTFVTYDNQTSIQAKIEYIKQKKTGIMFWDYGGDYQNELLQTIINNLEE